MINAPCKGCEKRYVGCHSKCPDYLAFKKAHDALLEKMRKEIDARVDADEVSKRRFKK